MAFLDTTGLERLWAHIVAKIGSKVDVVEGKGLSTEDYTTSEKNKVAGALDLSNAGTAIASNDDLNNYKTFGSYYSVAGSVSSTLSNTPVSGTGFRLIVQKGYGTRIQQIVFGNSSLVHVRTYNGTAWTEWAHMTSVSCGTEAYTAGTTELPTNYIYIQYE